jgi:pyruvate kinase
MLNLEQLEADQLRGIAPEHQLSSRNLVHYVAMRRRDLRELQTQLTDLGMSSIGRSEAYALSSVSRVVNLTNHILGERIAADIVAPCDHLLGAKLLHRHTRNLLGTPRSDRVTRIMVTMPTEAASNYRLVRALLENGMDCMRINCAHDDRSAWQAMIQHLHKARDALKVDCAILMDLAGPKLRTGRIEPAPAVTKIRPIRDAYGRVTKPARVWISAHPDAHGQRDKADGCLFVDHRWLSGVQRGVKIRFLDTRGRKRRLNVVEIMRGGIWAELNRTAYFTNGTILTRSGAHNDSTLKTEIFGIAPSEGSIHLSPGDALILTADAKAGTPAHTDSTGQVLSPASIPCTLPEALAKVNIGERVSLDDGQISGRVEAIDDEKIRVKIEHTPPHGAILKADKGINFPDSTLELPAITDTDAENIDFIAENADLIGLSFVNHERDVTSLMERLRAFTQRPPGIIIKIETRRGFERLPAILLSAMRHPRFGVMIARGDLAVECGYERLAELQEEILWMCEAAHCPAIWATQVLESMAKTGIPSRAEITDAAMSQRAECVMLNKGPYINDAVQILDHILKRMDPHQSKKSAKLRALKVALSFDDNNHPTEDMGAPPTKCLRQSLGVRSDDCSMSLRIPRTGALGIKTVTDKVHFVTER